MTDRFSEEQIINLLQEADRAVPEKERYRKHEFMAVSYYAIPHQSCGMEVWDAKRLMAL